MNSGEKGRLVAEEKALILGAGTSVERYLDDAAAPEKSEPLERAARFLRREMTLAWAACGAFEWVALGYLGFSSTLIVLFPKNLSHPARLIALQTFVAFLIFTLCRIEARTSEHADWGDLVRRKTAPSRVTASLSGRPTLTQRFWHFWRHWYPHLFFLFCFEELGYLVHLVNPGWEDFRLIAFDHWMFGVHPPVWLEQFATPARNDFFQFAYLTYFLYLLIVGGVLYFRRDWHAYWSVMTYSAMGYAIGYVIAILFPVESPWFATAGWWHGALQGGPFTATINFIEHLGRVRGAAFPSEHVAGSTAALWGAWRHRRWLFWTLLPFSLVMCASTVWGRYHYVADVLGGLITGTLGYVIGKWIMKSTSKIAGEGRCGSVSAAEPTSVRSSGRCL